MSSILQMRKYLLAFQIRRVQNSKGRMESQAGCPPVDPDHNHHVFVLPLPDFISTLDLSSAQLVLRAGKKFNYLISSRESVSWKCLKGVFKSVCQLLAEKCRQYFCSLVPSLPLSMAIPIGVRKSQSLVSQDSQNPNLWGPYGCACCLTLRDSCITHCLVELLPTTFSHGVQKSFLGSQACGAHL